MAEALLHSPLPLASLICVDVTDPVQGTLRAAGYMVTACSLSDLTAHASNLGNADLVLLDVSNGGQEKFEAVRRVRSAIFMSDREPVFLSFSEAHRNPRFVLELKSLGTRYARVDSPGLLVEAIELLLTEADCAASKRPCFDIWHRLSTGSCAPGEEIAAIRLFHNGQFFQISLALSGRFVFNYLAENHAIALDAIQIASGLSGWFYREHGLNGGSRQTVKVRIATIKVIVQRIRRALASAFARSGLMHDPYNVLRSFRAEGSNRALYQLHAEILWKHQLK